LPISLKLGICSNLLLTNKGNQVVDEVAGVEI